MLVRPRSTEKTRRVGKAGSAEAGAGTTETTFPTADMDAMVLAFVSSRKIAIPHAQLKHGIAAGVRERHVYGRKSRKCWYGCGAVSAAPRLLARTAALRCLRTGVYRARAEGVGPEKYDETRPMIAQLKYAAERRSTVGTTPRSAGVRYRRRRNGSGRRAPSTQTARDELIRRLRKVSGTQRRHSMRVYISRANRRTSARCIHQRHRITSRLEDCAVLHDASMPQNSRRVAAAANRGRPSRCATPLAQCSELAEGWRFYWQTARPRKKTVRGSSGELPINVAMYGNAGRGVWSRRRAGACLNRKSAAVS